jgi:hypothetical protein
VIARLRWWVKKSAYRRSLRPDHPTLAVRPERSLGRIMVKGREDDES